MLVAIPEGGGSWVKRKRIILQVARCLMVKTMGHPQVGLQGGWELGTEPKINQIMSSIRTLNTTSGENTRNDKRSHDLVETDESDVEVGDVWPRFLLIQPTDKAKPLTSLSPFALYKGIQGLAGTPENMKKLRSGDVLVEVSKKAHCVGLLRSKILVGIPVKVSAHKTLNIKKGVVRSRDLQECNEDEILEHLKSQGVTEVKRIVISRNGNKIKTGTLILTFALPTLPQAVKCLFCHLRVEPYIPNPLRCFKCQRYGHHKNNCKKDAACSKCASTEHEDISCQATTYKCVNCNGAHASFSRDCSVWAKEKKIQEVKHTRNISFPEARKIVEATPSNVGKVTYSAMVKSKDGKTSSVCCQTDVTWLYADSPSELQIDVETNTTSTSDSEKIVASAPAPGVTPGTSSTPAGRRINRPKSNGPSASGGSSGPPGKTQTTKKPKTILPPNDLGPKGRLKKGDRFQALRNIDLELELHASNQNDSLEEEDMLLS